MTLRSRDEVIRELAALYQAGDGHIIAPGPGTASYVAGQLEDVPCRAYGEVPKGIIALADPAAIRLAALLDFVHPGRLACLIAVPPGYLSAGELQNRLGAPESPSSRCDLIITVPPGLVAAYPRLLLDVLMEADPELGASLNASSTQPGLN